MEDGILTSPSSPIARSRGGELIARAGVGAAMGTAIWCMLFSLQLLPGFTADTWGVLLFALLGGVIDALGRFRLLLTICVVLAVIVFAVTQTSVSNALAQRLIRDDTLPAAPMDAVVVLSGGVNPDSTINADALDNLLYGLELTRGGRAPELVTTTVGERFPGGEVSSVLDQSRIISQFGASVKWLQTRQTASTRDEALKTADLLRPNGTMKIAVVAQPMQTRRACAAFEAVGFRVYCVSPRVRSYGGPAPAPWPRDRLRVFGDWVYEVCAIAEYRARGWIGS